MMRALALLACLALPLPAMAQERIANQPYAVQMTRQTLNNKLADIKARIADLNAFTSHAEVCANLGATYAPGNPKADPATGCLNPLVALTTQVVSASYCYSNNNTYTRTVSCPAGSFLLGCSGGEGGQQETDEGYTIQPLAGSNGCQMSFSMPDCQSSWSWTQARLYAYCGKFQQ